MAAGQSGRLLLMPELLPMILSILYSVFLTIQVSVPAPHWGFYGHERINRLAVYLLPPDMLGFYKSHIHYLGEHATDPDKRRYAIPGEGPRHYIDIDHYGAYPYPSLPRKWADAVAKYGEDSLKAHGIVPWHVQVMQRRLTRAFSEKDASAILKYSAEIGHYIADAHVPLHSSSNHNGQFTNQRGIHGFWESRVPELLAGPEFDFFIGHAGYIADPGQFIWDRVLESAAAVDSVLLFEKALSEKFSPDLKYAFEDRNGRIMRQYSSAYTKAYNASLDGMVERRMRQSVYAVASFWYTAWVDAGQPELPAKATFIYSAQERAELDSLNRLWRTGSRMLGRDEGDG